MATIPNMECANANADEVSIHFQSTSDNMTRNAIMLNKGTKIMNGLCMLNQN